MKFVERLTSLETGPKGLVGQLDGSHQLTVEALTPTIVRVLIRKNGQLRLDRTWSIACGGESVPWEGLSRLELPTAAFDREDHDLVTGPVRLRIHPDPYQLEWFYLGKSVLKERSTGSLALGRRDHRLWHFHQLRPESRFYGLGERSGELDRRGRRFEMRNVDPMGYDARTTDPLYKHFPFYLEQNDTGCFGLFYDNFANCFFDLGQEIDNYHGPFTSYRAADGDFDLYFLAGDSLLEVTRSFCWLTGRTYLPPKWSLGYSTTSMHYTDHPQAQRRIEQFLDEAEAHQLELATFKYGSGYTTRDTKRYVFTWNDQKFPDPKALNARFHERGVRLAANVKPVLLADHPAYDQARPLFVQDSELDGPEVSQFWDNRGSHLDFSNPDTVAWWQRQAQAQVLDYGFDALWNDNNEYVIWDDEARCHGFGKPFPIGLVRPLMSQWMTRASHEVTQAQHPDRRVWSISRCGCPGMQRYAQTWSGDNRTHWETLEYNHKMALGLSMSGVYNLGHDVGGFSGPAPDPELLARWFFVGAFYPRFGVNSWKPEATLTEPWMHPEMWPTIEKALALRQRFLPHLYSLMVEAHRFHTPVIRPTFYHYPDGHDSEFLWGDNLLVAPVWEQGATRRQLFLPTCPQGWWDFWTRTHYAGGQTVTLEAPLDTIPLLVRGGSALFLAAPGRRELHSFEGGPFETTFYDDDGETYNYRHGEFLRIHFNSAGELRLEGSYRPDCEVVVV